MTKKAKIYFGTLLIIGLILIIQGLQHPQNQIAPQPTSVPTQTPTQAPVEASSSANFDTTGLESGTVSRVVDGDTIEVEINGKKQKVRYIGVNTPETVDPRRGVQCFGHEASDENKSLVEGKTVILTKDVSETDKYGRLLRFVYLPVGNGQLLFVNDFLVRQGYAQVDTFPPDVKMADQFVAAQNEARQKNLGLWAKCQ